MTKVLVIGDQHFKVDNIQDVDVFIERTTELIQKEIPDFIVLLGDLLDTHERIHSTPLNRAYKFIDNIRKYSEVFILVGNHDMINNKQYLNDNHWLNGLKEWDDVTVVDKVIEYRSNDLKFIFCPYVEPGRFEEALSTLPTLWEDSNCIFAHQEFYGCKMGAFNSIDGDKWKLEYPHVVSGHIHLNHKPQENIYYPGSSISVAFGESSKNIIAKLTFNNTNEKYNLEEIDLHLPKKKILYIDSEKVDDIIIPENQDKIKLSISGLYEEFKSFKKTKKYKDLINKGVKIVFKPKKKEILNKKEKLKDSIENNTNKFEDIIHDLIQSEKCSYLVEAYELIINSKEVYSNDILFL